MVAVSRPKGVHPAFQFSRGRMLLKRFSKNAPYVICRTTKIADAKQFFHADKAGRSENWYRGLANNSFHL